MYLELVDLVLVVAQLLQDTRQLTLVLRADLVTANSIVEARRSADEDLLVLLLGLRKDGLQEFLGDVALAAGPLLGRLVEEVESLEALGVGVLEILELLLQEDVILADVTVDKSNLGLVLGVLEDLADELVHGSDTGTTGNQGNVLMLVGLPLVFGERALEGKTLVNVHAVQVLRHRSVGVGLDDKLEVARLVCHGDKYLLLFFFYIMIIRGQMVTFIAGGGVRTEDGLLGANGLELGQESS